MIEKITIQPVLKHLVFLLWILLLGACKHSGERVRAASGLEESVAVGEEVSVQAEPALPPLESLADTAFVRLSDYCPDFSYDLRYATEDNFLETAVYECPKCYTRARTARALIAANRELMERGVRIRFFDCYRPNSVQYKMWEILPNPQYVANPQKGSHHNRGGAVDITLETLDGKPLDMGTDFDFFGRRAYHDTRDLPAHILENRSLLKQTMEKHGFQSVRTEWWHYNLKAAFLYPVADFRWPCLP